MEINWMKPSESPPPFEEQIMLMLGGQGSNNAGRTFERYVKIMNGIISHRSPNDDDEGSEQHAFLCGDLGDFDDYQFMVYAYDEWKFGGAEDDDSDWFSDSIIAWAPMPDVSALQGV